MEERENVLTLTDEEGNEVDFEIINAVEYNQKTYLLLIEADADDEAEAEALMLRVDDDGEDDVLVTVDDEDEFNAVAALFDEQDGEYDLMAMDGEEHECGCDCGHCHKDEE